MTRPSIDVPPEPVLPSTSYSAPLTIMDSVSSPVFNLQLYLFPISEKSPLSSPPLMFNKKGKARTEAPFFVLYIADLHHPLATTMGTTVETSLGEPLSIGQLKLEGLVRYFSGWKPSVRAWLVEVEWWIHLMSYPPADEVDIVVT